jgi:hypothetical protein
MINKQYKFIYVGVPKTGTTSIESHIKTEYKIVSDCHKKHTPICLHNEKYLDYFKFGFVRNPWDWVVSWYFYATDHWGSPVRDQMSLKDWVSIHNACGCRPLTVRCCYQPLVPQYNFLCDDQGELMMDFVGRFENLQCDFDTACEKIGISKHKLDFKNKSQRSGSYEDFYDSETRDLVSNLFEKDIDLFKYSFGD